MTNIVDERAGEWRASVYLTRRCDLRCWYCSVPLIDAVVTEELSVSKWKTAVDRLYEMGVRLIVNTGGEPFLRQDLLREIIPYQIAKGIYPVLLTNGRLLANTDRAKETLQYLVEQGLDCLSVSIDTNEYDPLNSEGAISKAATGEEALEYAAKLGMKDLSFTAVIDETNPDEGLGVLERFQGRYDALVQVVVREGQIFSQADDAYLDRPSRTWFEDSLRYIKRNADRFGVHNAGPYLDGILSGDHKKWSCWLPGHVVVAPTGAVQLCNTVYGHNLFTELNLAKTQLRGEELKKHYEELWYKDLAGFCPGCYMRCHVDFHANANGGDIFPLEVV